MSADILALVVRGTVALSAALIVILVLRQPVRAAFGAHIAYAFWLIAPIAVAASFLPARRIYLDAPIVASAPAPQMAEVVSASTPTMQGFAASFDAMPWLLAIWIAGVGFSIAAQLVGQHRFLRVADQAGPALVGVLRPRIILPRDFDQRFTAQERTLVIAHERAHLAAGDAQINAVAALVQCLNWFNPLVHVARAALRVDQELACDARVMAKHANARRTYAEAMLKTQLSAHVAPLGCQWPPLGVEPLKQRIGMLARPRPPVHRRALGAALCTLTITAGAAAAWIAQPPSYVHASERGATISERVLGAALVAAVQRGDFAEARELVAAGANVNHFTAGDGTALVITARFGDVDFARELIAHGAEVNMRAPGDGNPLIMASAYGHLDMARLLVENGADVNAHVRGDETPLINAARENRLNVARYLIAQGADVNLEVTAPTIDGSELRSPMSEARRRNHTEMIALLRAHGATPR